MERHLRANPFADYKATPTYQDTALYTVAGSTVRVWEFDGWQPESLSWKSGCYIHAGLSGRGPAIFTGSEAEKFLSGICVNNFSRFRPGSAKHAIMCDDSGLITAHGVLQRHSPDRFSLYASGGWSLFQQSVSKLDVKVEIADRYLFQVAGPTSLQTLEAATGESLRDIAFLRFRDATIAGLKVEIMRIGMSGTLAYEVHGPMDDAERVYAAIVSAGDRYGIQRLGWRAYMVNHVEGGFPQSTWTFHIAATETPAYRAFVESRGPAARFQLQPRISGSVDPDNLRARYRTPYEVGWDKSVRYDHAFIGRAALERELENGPKKRIVTLAWNAEDVIDIFASLYREGETYQYMDMPTTPHARDFLAHADHVCANGREVGVSSGTIYSYFFRQTLSLCTIDADCAAIGTEVIVKWGNHGGRIKDVRATVARFPYLDQGRNQTVDISQIAPGAPPA